MDEIASGNKVMHVSEKDTATADSGEPSRFTGDPPRLIAVAMCAGAAVSAGAGLFVCAKGEPVAGVCALLGAGALLSATLVCRLYAARLRREATERAVCAEADIADARAGTEAVLSEAQRKIKNYHRLISHGFRIPISIIMGYADILMSDMAPDESVRHEYLKKMQNKAAYMNELLTYSLIEMRTDVGADPPIMKSLDLTTLLRGVAESMRELAAKQGVEIRLVAAPEEIIVNGNAVGLSKAFYNILENALKYMGTGGRHVNITLSAPTAAEALIVFKDDGQGLDADETKHIFEMNRQGPNRRTDGNGIGLWIVKTEVESLGGTVGAKSEKGKGMGIYITLPVAVPPENSLKNI